MISAVTLDVASVSPLVNEASQVCEIDSLVSHRSVDNLPWNIIDISEKQALILNIFQNHIAWVLSMKALHIDCDFNHHFI